MSTASGLEEPSVILRREAEKPKPNWKREELYETMPVNGHAVQCRCQIAILQDYLVELRVLHVVLRNSEMAARNVARAYGYDAQVFIQAIDVNDRLTEEELRGVHQALEKSGDYHSPEMYHLYQALAPKKLREVADHYERHGL